MLVSYSKYIDDASYMWIVKLGLRMVYMLMIEYSCEEWNPTYIPRYEFVVWSMSTSLRFKWWSFLFRYATMFECVVYSP